MNLTTMSDQTLWANVKTAAAEERAALTKVLHHLLEIETRKLYLARGFSSLYAMCTEYVGYSNYEAHVRIQAMRLMREIPVIEEKIEAGELSLTVAASAQAAFRREKKKRTVAKSEKLALIEDLCGLSTREADFKIAEAFPGELEPEKTKAISDDQIRIEFNANREQLEKFKRLKNHFAHTNYEGRWDLLFEKLADLALAKIDAEFLCAPKVTEKPQSPGSRHIPKSATQRIWHERSEGCAFVDPVTKRRCGETHGLQRDHIIEFARGGNHDAENLRWLCGAHNRYRNELREPAKPYRLH